MLFLMNFEKKAGVTSVAPGIGTVPWLAFGIHKLNFNDKISTPLALNMLLQLPRGSV
jgi:hypothetical protein